MNKMDFSTFCSTSIRKDSVANDSGHFFATKFAPRLAHILYSCGASPNAITLAFFLAGFAAAVSLYFDGYILCMLFWRLHIVLDMADGIVARATKRFSKSAQGFDRSNHIIINTTIIFAGLSPNVNYVALNVVIVTFYLSYFFSRNYFQEKQKSRATAIHTVLVKNAVGLEGLIMLLCLLPLLGVAKFETPIAIAYAFCFGLLFTIKLVVFWKSDEI